MEGAQQQQQQQQNGDAGNATRARASSSVALRPSLGQTLTRMRSRSLLKAAGGGEPISPTDATVDGAGQQQQHQHVTAPSIATSHASYSVPSSTSSSSFGYSETDSTDGSDFAFTPTSPALSSLFGGGDGRDEGRSSSEYDAAASSLSSYPGPLPAAKLPHLPRRGTFSRFLRSAATGVAAAAAAGAGANPFAAGPSQQYQNASSSSSSAYTPRLNRQQSYLALSIPPTPGASPSMPLQQLKGDDEDRRLPSPVREDSAHPYDALAARPSTSSFPLGLATAADSSTAGATTLSGQAAARQQSLPLSKLLPPVLFLLSLFCVSLVCIYYAISTIPLTLPHNISEIRQQSTALRDYSRRGFTEGLHVSAVLSAIFVFKQAFSVPGSILVNILFGSLYGTYAATLCACLFTGVGSVCAYYMAKLCAPLVERFFPRALATTRSTLLSGSSADLFSYLLLARLFPLLPYSVLNIACGVLKIPVGPYFITLVLGSFPYNFVTTQLGDLLGSLTGAAGIDAIWTWDLCFKLAVASVLSAAPLLFKEQLRAYLGAGKTSAPGASASAKLVASRPLNAQDIPLLRRDRTDSTASEVLAAPAMLPPQRARTAAASAAADGRSRGHAKKWSFSWSEWRHSPANDSGYSSGRRSPVIASSSGRGHAAAGEAVSDAEEGDTDEEDARERRVSDSRRSSRSFEQPVAAPSSQRRMASIETSATINGHNHHYSSPSPASSYFFDAAPRRSPSASSAFSEWDRF